MILALKRLIVLSCIIIIASEPSFAYLNTTLAQTYRNEDPVAEMLLSILEEVNGSVLEAFEQLEAQGISVPEEAMEKYHNGLSLANESVILMEKGRPREANEKAVEASQMFKEALIIAQEVLQQEPTGAEVASEKTIRLGDSINRAHEQMQRLENLTKLIAAEGYNSTSIQIRIEEARGLLEEATTKLNAGDFDEAADDLVTVKTLFLQSEEQLKRLAEDIKAQRIQTFLAETEKRIADLKENIDSISDQLSPQIKNASLTVLSEAEDSILEAKTFLEERMINETISEISNAREKEKEAIDLIKSAVPSFNTTQNMANVTPGVADEYKP